jgi:ankyrin repeat protein
MDHAQNIAAEKHSNYKPLNVLCQSIDTNNHNVDKSIIFIPRLRDTFTQAMHQSILDGRLKQIEYFLELGSKVDGKDKYGRTCIMIACLSDHEAYGLKVLKLLLKNGADLNETDTLGRSVLMLCCSEKREKILNYLLDNHSEGDFSFYKFLSEFII